MSRVVRTRSANADVVSISWYIAQDNPSAADQWLDDLDESLKLLAKFPEIGERVDHLSAGMRRTALASICSSTWHLKMELNCDGCCTERVKSGTCFDL